MSIRRPTLQDDFTLGPIIRMVQSEGEWAQGDLNHEIDNLVLQQYRDRYNPGFGEGASDEYLRMIRNQIVAWLQREGIIEHTGYGRFNEFVYTVL